MSMHHEWLALVEISGPFLAVPVLKEAFPQGLEELDAPPHVLANALYHEGKASKLSPSTTFHVSRSERRECSFVGLK